MTRLKQLFLVLIGVLLITGPTWAQVNKGSITGIVADQTGAVVPGVAITVTNAATGVPSNVTSNSSGIYFVPLLDPAVYKLVAVKEGFKKYTQTNIILNVGQTVRVDFSLSLGAKTETVEVQASALQIERETSDNGTTITAREEEDLPLTSFGDQRTPATFMQLAPGVTGEGNSDGGPGANRTMTTMVSGSMVSSTTLMLDGADVNSNGGFEGDLRGFQVPPDAIGEFKLESTNASAEYGRSGGGTASFQVKSGTNQIHGTGYEYVRNDTLNANGFFPNVGGKNCQGHACRSPYKHNEFGVAAGGPIKKDKAFIFGYYDGFRLTQAASTGLATIPTAQMLQGDFTNYGYTQNGNFVMQPVFDPSVQAAMNTKYNAIAAADKAAGRTFNPATEILQSDTCGPTICGNKILSQSSWDPVTVKVLPLIPHPTNADPRAVVNNFSANIANTNRVDEWGLKGDYNINEKNRLAVTFITGKQSTPNIPLIPAPLGGGAQPSLSQTRNARLNWNLTARPNLINQATLMLNQWNSGTQQVATYAGKANWVDYLGIKGVTPNYKTQFPQIVINQQSWNGGGGAGLGNQHTSGILDSMTWIKGKHTAKFGFTVMKMAENDISTGNSAGYFNFLNDETGLGAFNAVTGVATASFLLGRADEGRTSAFTTPAYSRMGYYAAFAQDDYKITKKLTLNLGVRWDLFTPVTHKYFHKSWISGEALNTALTPNAIPGVFQLASASNPSGMNTYYRNFSPRIGLAYSVNDKTVIRAGYGIFYAQGNGDRVDGQSTVQGFNQTVTSGTSSNQGVTPGFIWGTQSLPAVPVPSFGPLSQLGQGTPRHSAGTLIRIDRSDSLAPYMQNYTFSVQRTLPAQMLLTVAFVGNEGTHEASRVMPWDQMLPQYLSLGPTLGSTGQSVLTSPITDPLVQAQPGIAAMPIDPATGHHTPFHGYEALYSGVPNAGPGGSTSANGYGTMGNALRQYPQYQGVHRYYEGVGVSNYDALQVKLDKRFSNGLTLLVSYSWSKALTDGGSIFSTFSSEFYTNTPWNRHAQKGYSFEDIPHNLSMAYVYDLPFGKGKKYLNQGGVVNQIVGGWKTSGILRYLSGRPMNIEASGTTATLEDHGWQSPNTVDGVPKASVAMMTHHFDPRPAGGTPDSMFNPAGFTQPDQWTYGKMQQTEATVRDFRWPNEDLSFIKVWPIHESWNLQLNADFFNIFNRTVFGENNGAYANEPGLGAGFGYIGSQVNNARVVQFALRLKW